MSETSEVSKDVFDELYEVLFAEDQEKAKEKIRARRLKLPVDHTTYNFLENEQVRLKLLDILLTKKITTWEHNEQVGPLVLRAYDVLNDIKTELARRLSTPHSHARINLSIIFDKAYSN